MTGSSDTGVNDCILQNMESGKRQILPLSLIEIDTSELALID